MSAEVWRQVLTNSQDFGRILELVGACLERMNPELLEAGGLGLRTRVVRVRDEELQSEIQLRVYPHSPDRVVDPDNLDRFRLLIEFADEHWAGLLGEDSRCVVDIQLGFTLEAPLFCTTMVQSQFHHTASVFERLSSGDGLQLGGAFKVTAQGAKYQPYSVRASTGPDGEMVWTTEIGPALNSESPSLKDSEIERIWEALRAFSSSS